MPDAAGREFVHHPILSHFSKIANAALVHGTTHTYTHTLSPSLHYTTLPI